MVGAVLALLLLSYLGQIARHVFGYTYVFGLIDYFNVDEESNLPTTYQFLALLACSVVMAVTPQSAYRLHWKLLAIIFAFLAVDEISSIHEMTMNPVYRIAGELPGVWGASWVVVAIPLVCVVVLAYLKFFFAHLQRREQVQVAAAALLFVGGAVGVEMATRLFVDTTLSDYKQTIGYATLAHVEEGLEMLGVVVFLDFLLKRSGRLFLVAEEALHRPEAAARGDGSVSALHPRPAGDFVPKERPAAAAARASGADRRR